MRKSTLDPQEVLERDEFERTQYRKAGLDLMPVRDKGAAKLSNGVIIAWHTDRPLDDGEARGYVPDGHFTLTMNNRTLLFNVEEFNKYTRWA